MVSKISNEKIYGDLFALAEADSIPKNSLLEILKDYSSTISVFELMNMMAYSDSTFEGVSDKWKKLGSEMQVKTFIDRIKMLNVDETDYDGEINSIEFKKYVTDLKYTQDQYDETLSTEYTICILSVLYANFILEEPIHPEGYVFPGSGEVIKRNDKYYCPARDGNENNPKAFCRLCVAYQLED